jgi:hypothetical protein
MVLGLFLLILGAFGLLSAANALFQGEFDESGIFPLTIFLLIFFSGLKLFRNNRSSQGSYHHFSPYYQTPVHWVAVVLVMYFFFPAGLYLLIKKMSQYQTRAEALKNSRTLKKWALGFGLAGAFFLIGITSALYGRDLEMAFPAVLAIFATIVILLLYKSSCLKKISAEPISVSRPSASSPSFPATPAPNGSASQAVSTPAQASVNQSSYASDQGGSFVELLLGLAALLTALWALFT